MGSSHKESVLDTATRVELTKLTREAKRSLVLDSPATANALLFWDDEKLVSCHYDKIIRIWNVNSGICLQTIAGHVLKYGVQTLLRWNDFLRSGAEDIRMWDFNSGKVAKICDVEGTHISKIVCDERLLVAGCPRHHAARVWDLETGYNALYSFCPIYFCANRGQEAPEHVAEA